MCHATGGPTSAGAERITVAATERLERNGADKKTSCNIAAREECNAGRTRVAVKRGMAITSLERQDGYNRGQPRYWTIALRSGCHKRPQASAKPLVAIPWDSQPWMLCTSGCHNIVSSSTHGCAAGKTE